jgi:hypothetical protein
MAVSSGGIVIGSTRTGGALADLQNVGVSIQSWLVTEAKPIADKIRATARELILAEGDGGINSGPVAIAISDWIVTPIGNAVSGIASKIKAIFGGGGTPVSSGGIIVGTAAGEGIDIGGVLVSISDLFLSQTGRDDLRESIRGQIGRLFNFLNVDLTDEGNTIKIGAPGADQIEIDVPKWAQSIVSAFQNASFDTGTKLAHRALVTPSVRASSSC